MGRYPPQPFLVSVNLSLLSVADSTPSAAMLPFKQARCELLAETLLIRFGKAISNLGSGTTH